MSGKSFHDLSWDVQPGVAEHFGHMGNLFEKYDVANYVPCAKTTTQVWNANWKIAWDNYLENYHIPIGHPGLHRLLRPSAQCFNFSFLRHQDRYWPGIVRGKF